MGFACWAEVALSSCYHIVVNGSYQPFHHSQWPAIYFFPSLSKHPSIEVVKPLVPTLSLPVSLLRWMYACESASVFKGARVWSTLIRLCSREWSINEDCLSEPKSSLHICDPSVWAKTQRSVQPDLNRFSFPLCWLKGHGFYSCVGHFQVQMWITKPEIHPEIWVKNYF